MEDIVNNFIKLNNIIFRNNQIYLDKVLKKYELSSGTFYYLFILERNEGIIQNEISKRIGHDKAMSARAITKLISLNYLYKEENGKDGRAYNLYLTEKAKQVLPEIHMELQHLINTITEDLTEEEKRIMMKGLKNIFYRTQELNGRRTHPKE